MRENPMEIVQLKESDIHSFRALMELFYDAFKRDQNYCKNPPTTDYVKSLLNNPNVIHLIAKDKEEVIGGLVAYILPKFEQERSEVYIYDLAVHENYRRKKVATRMIEELRSIAKTCGAWVIFVQADYEDEPAIKLYESLGTREEVLHFDISI